MGKFAMRGARPGAARRAALAVGVTALLAMTACGDDDDSAVEDATDDRVDADQASAASEVDVSSGVGTLDDEPSVDEAAGTAETGSGADAGDESDLEDPDDTTAPDTGDEPDDATLPEVGADGCPVVSAERVNEIFGTELPDVSGRDLPIEIEAAGLEGIVCAFGDLTVGTVHFNLYDGSIDGPLDEIFDEEAGSTERLEGVGDDAIIDAFGGLVAIAARDADQTLVLSVVLGGSEASPTGDDIRADAITLARELLG
jgi:hypothetical protein